MHQAISANTIPTPSQIADLRLAASQLTGDTSSILSSGEGVELLCRLCPGRQNALWIEPPDRGVGIGRKANGSWAQSGFSENRRWAQRYLEAPTALRQLAEAHVLSFKI